MTKIKYFLAVLVLTLILNPLYSQKLYNTNYGFLNNNVVYEFTLTFDSLSMYSNGFTPVYANGDFQAASEINADSVYYIECQFTGSANVAGDSLKQLLIYGTNNIDISPQIIDTVSTANVKPCIKVSSARKTALMSKYMSIAIPKGATGIYRGNHLWTVVVIIYKRGTNVEYN